MPDNIEIIPPKKVLFIWDEVFPERAAEMIIEGQMKEAPGGASISSPAETAYSDSIKEKNTNGKGRYET
jgi:hypothetical protein